MKNQTPFWQSASVLIATTGRTDLLAYKLRYALNHFLNRFRSREKKVSKMGSGAGTAGSVVALLLLMLVSWNTLSVLLVIFTSFLAGILTVSPAAAWLYDKYGPCLRHDGQETTFDYNQINIDEFHGMFLSVLPLYLLMDLLGPCPEWFQNTWLLLAFVLFRYFDAKKVGLVKMAEDLYDGPFGVMIDDTVAGVQTMLVVGAVAPVMAFFL